MRTGAVKERREATMKTALGYVASWIILTLGFGLGSQWHYGSVNWLESAGFAVIFLFGLHFYQNTTSRLDTLERKVRSLEAINQANWDAWAKGRRAP